MVSPINFPTQHPPKLPQSSNQPTWSKAKQSLSKWEESLLRRSLARFLLQLRLDFLSSGTCGCYLTCGCTCTSSLSCSSGSRSDLSAPTMSSLVLDISILDISHVWEHNDVLNVYEWFVPPLWSCPRQYQHSWELCKASLPPPPSRN